MKELEIIAIAESPYKERFGIPRQPGLVDAKGSIIMQKGFQDPAMLAGLEEFSHIWVTFLFHANMEEGWNKKVRPPRLGSKQKVGVFASRSPYRPNSLGQSVLKLEAVHTDKPVHLKVSGLDLLDGTPIVDIKPYVSYSDSVPDAQSGFAPHAPEHTQEIIFSEETRAILKTRTNAKADEELIRQVLALDPRPAYKHKQKQQRRYGMLLGDYEVKWEVEGNRTLVVELNVQS